MPSETYSEFIDEVFIKSLRSVLIVDDDYPTFDDFLGGASCVVPDGSPTDSSSGSGSSGHSSLGLCALGQSEKQWVKNPGYVKEVIGQFRNSNPPLLVDIHDGRNVSTSGEIEEIKHLHQSDLLVLDYSLERHLPDDGQRAVAIIRALLKNSHFNLVVLHSTLPVEQTFNGILMGLTAPVMLDTEAYEEFENVLESVDLNIIEESKRLHDSIGHTQYFMFRLEPSKIEYFTKMAEFSHFKLLCDQVGWGEDRQQEALRYLFWKFEQKHGSEMCDSLADGLIWSETGKWLKNDRIFVAFCQKEAGFQGRASGASAQLLSVLSKALRDWSPQPSRLILAKIRNQIDEHGVESQSLALGNRHALAHWYHELLTANEAKRKWSINESVSRHSEQLMAAVLPGVESFASSLIAADTINNSDAIEVCRSRYKVDLAKLEDKTKASFEHNAFVCSKAPTGWHLTTGHIFSFDGGYWVCLSPACDMVPSVERSKPTVHVETALVTPSRKADGASSLGGKSAKEGDAVTGESVRSKYNNSIFVGVRQFMAVRIEIADEKVKKIREKSNTGRFLVLNIDGKLGYYCFNKPTDESQAPLWQILYIENDGVFDKDTFCFRIARGEWDGTKPAIKSYDAEVVTQLRYEYALNLMQRLGGVLTRVGLDFSN